MQNSTVILPHGVEAIQITKLSYAIYGDCPMQGYGLVDTDFGFAFDRPTDC